MAEIPQWPRTIKGPIPKPSASARKALKRKDRRTATTMERDNKQAAKVRDGYRCRFPLCGCRPLGLALASAHLQHKGMGGNPAGDRSTTAGLITVCSARHRESLFSIDKGSIEVRPRTAAGADGPVEWWLDAAVYTGDHHRTHWVLLAKEERIGLLMPISLQASELLHGLARLMR